MHIEIKISNSTHNHLLSFALHDLKLTFVSLIDIEVSIVVLDTVVIDIVEVINIVEFIGLP